MGEKQLIIINAIKENNTVTISELTKIVGISSVTIEKHLAKLKNSKIIERIGSDKEGCWGKIKAERFFNLSAFLWSRRESNPRPNK
ncbi:MAG: ArsR family transcriptional regulator [Chlorobi bacterium]|nr:ArsR family transcriptional regulator [Chlorobiota bacterium]